MLCWSLLFLIGAVLAALFGFGVIAIAAAGIARILFYLFAVVFVGLLVLGLLAR